MRWLVTGSAALLLSLYVSRVVHPNYLILAAVLLPAAVAGGAVLATDALIGGLALLALGAEIADKERRGPKALAALVNSEIARLSPILQAPAAR